MGKNGGADSGEQGLSELDASSALLWLGSKAAMSARAGKLRWKRERVARLSARE
jgi:hypothetical protein